jgi:hypothetical protein
VSALWQRLRAVGMAVLVYLHYYHLKTAVVQLDEEKSNDLCRVIVEEILLATFELELKGCGTELTAKLRRLSRVAL